MAGPQFAERLRGAPEADESNPIAPPRLGRWLVFLAVTGATSAILAGAAPAERSTSATFDLERDLPKAEVKVDPEKMKQNLDQAIRQLNDSMRDGGRNLAFAMDEVLGRPVIVVKKQDTGEVIRQIPNEVVIKVAHSLDKLKGLFFNSEA